MSFINKDVIKAPRIRFLFAWYDLWVGAYWDRKGFLYILPIPMFGIVIDCRRGGEVQRWARDIRDGGADA